MKLWHYVGVLHYFVLAAMPVMHVLSDKVVGSLYERELISLVFKLIVDSCRRFQFVDVPIHNFA